MVSSMPCSFHHLVETFGLVLKSETLNRFFHFFKMRVSVRVIRCLSHSGKEFRNEFEEVSHCFFCSRSFSAVRSGILFVQPKFTACFPDALLRSACSVRSPRCVSGCVSSFGESCVAARATSWNYRLRAKGECRGPCHCP